MNAEVVGVCCRVLSNGMQCCILLVLQSACMSSIRRDNVSIFEHFLTRAADDIRDY